MKPVFNVGTIGKSVKESSSLMQRILLMWLLKKSRPGLPQAWHVMASLVAYHRGEEPLYMGYLLVSSKADKKDMNHSAENAVASLGSILGSIE